MTDQEIANDKLMHYHAHQCCQLPSREARITFIEEIEDKYGLDWKIEVQKRTVEKWEADKKKAA